MNCGEYNIHESEGQGNEFSTQYRKVSLDVESKRLVETKMHNRFYEEYSKQLGFFVDMPGYSDIHIGKMYEVTLPSTSRKDPTGEVENNNEPFSGLWLHTRKVHKLRLPGGSSAFKYDAESHFKRTGLEISNSFIKNHRKVGE